MANSQLLVCVLCFFANCYCAPCISGINTLKSQSQLPTAPVGPAYFSRIRADEKIYVHDAMADTDRVVFPAGVGDAKETGIAVQPENGDSNFVQEASPRTPPQIRFRNVIVVPGNCPSGYRLDVNGDCRAVF